MSPSKNTIKLRLVKSNDAVSTGPGCYIWKMDHVISVNEFETEEIKMKTVDWAKELTELFGRANTEAIHQLIQGLRTKYNGEFCASKLLEKLDQLPPAEAPWTFTSLAAVILTALTIFLVGALIWRKCCQAQEQVMLAPSAPPMSMPIINPGPVDKATK